MILFAALFVASEALSFNGGRGGKRPPKWVQQKTAPPSSRQPPKKELQFEVVIGDDGELAMAAVERVPRNESSSIRGDLEKIYSEYNPEKLGDIDDLLEKYSGREALLLSAVQAKYLGFASGYKPPEEEKDDRREEISRLVDGLPQTAFELAAYATEDVQAEDALKACVASMVSEEGKAASAFAIAKACPAKTFVDTDDDARLGNCRGVMGAFGAGLKYSQFTETDDLFVAAACACAAGEDLDEAVRKLLGDDRETQVPEQTALVLCELSRRLLKESKKGEKRPWPLVLELARFSLKKTGGERPETTEVVTRAMVGHVQRLTDATAMAHLPKHALPEIVCVGRSNAGKSSLVNALLGRKALAPISSEPGRTRRFVFYKVNNFDPQFALVDVPGSGFAAVLDEDKTKIDSWRSLTERYLRIRDNLSAVLHLVDSRRASQGQLPKADLETLDLCVAANAQRSSTNNFLHAIVLTKIDRLSPKQQQKAIETVSSTLKQHRSQLVPLLVDQDGENGQLLSAQRGLTVPILLSSATRKQGQTALWLTIASVLKSTRDDDDALYDEEDDDDLISF